MAFWDIDKHDRDSIALITPDSSLSYGDLLSLTDAWDDAMPQDFGTFGVLQMPPSVGAISHYLACLRGGKHVPLLMQSTVSPDIFAGVIDHYQPDWISIADTESVPENYRLAFSKDGQSLYVNQRQFGQPPHPDLALLLSTSGSTGSSKLVRLSKSAVASNAVAISQYLELDSSDRAITTLPLGYSFGMSILNSHLQVGGSIVLTDTTMMDRAFWQLAKGSEITSLSGVPATFEMLARLGIERLGLRHLRMLTQAGGRLRDDLIQSFEIKSRQLGLKFFVMYGQTEASPRISYVPPERLGEKIGSIGVAVPGGRMSLDDNSGELIYVGPNVMMGYAESREELSKPDEQLGVLRTGDLARVDEDGFYYITGRLKRFIKISGSRINLDDVERILSSEFNAHFVCTGTDDNLCIFMTDDNPVPETRISRLLQERSGLFPGHIRVIKIAELPLMTSGKVDYQSLNQLSTRK